MRTQTKHSLLPIATLALLAFGQIANAGPMIDGQIFRANGTPLDSAVVESKIQIRTPSNNCLMYEEIKSLNMTGSEGVFAFTLDDGTGVRQDTTGFSMTKIFSNLGDVLTFPTATCASGTTYTPSVGDVRLLSIAFRENGGAFETMAPQTIAAVGSAIEAQQVAGFPSTALLRVKEASGGALGNISPLSNAQYTELLALANGTSTVYGQANKLNGKIVPTLSAGQVLGYDGTNWVARTALTDATALTSPTNIVLTPSAGGYVQVANATASTSASTGAFVINGSGGLGVGGNVNSGGNISAIGSVSAALQMVTPQTFGSTTAAGTIKIDGTSNATSGNVLLASASGNVGVGITAPSSKLHVAADSTATGLTSGQATQSVFTYAPTSAATSRVRGAYNIALLTGNYGSQTDIIGVEGFALNQGAGSTNSIAGVTGSVRADAGTVSNAYGISAGIASGSGTITNAYGVYIGSISSGTSKYSIFAADGTAKNYFAGKTGIGVVPSATLQLKPSDGTSGAAPLKLTAGTNLVTPEPGAIEFDGTSLFYTDSTNTRKTLNVVGNSSPFPSGSSGAPSISFSTNSGSGLYSPGANQLGLSTNGSEAMRIASSGNVGIGTTAPTYKLDVNGGININGNNLYITGVSICTSAGCTSVSDRRYKTNILPLEESFENILKLEGKSYDWKDKKRFGDHHQIGFIAQDLEKVFPEVVQTDAKGYKTVMYDKLVAPLVEAFKTLAARVTSTDEVVAKQSREIASLKEDAAQSKATAEELRLQNAELQSRLEKIERVLGSK